MRALEILLNLMRKKCIFPARTVQLVELQMDIFATKTEQAWLTIKPALE